MKTVTQYRVALCLLWLLVAYAGSIQYCRADDGKATTVDFPVARMPKQFTYTYGKHIVVKDGDANYEKLKEFMLKEQHGWTNNKDWQLETNVLANQHNYESPTMTIRCDDTLGHNELRNAKPEYFAYVDYKGENGEWVNLVKTLKTSCPLP